MKQLSPEAHRQYIDARSVFTAYEEALESTLALSGGMYWHKGPPNSPESRYLVRTTPEGWEQSLGKRSAETDALYADFVSRKDLARERLAGLRRALAQNERLNGAVRVGRTPAIVVDILHRLAQQGTVADFQVIGTQALFGYETITGYLLSCGADPAIDVFSGSKDHLELWSESFIAGARLEKALHKVDATFQKRRRMQNTFENKRGFKVHLITPATQHGALGREGGSIWAHYLRTDGSTANVTSSEIVVSPRGRMARMYLPRWPVAVLAMRHISANGVIAEGDAQQISAQAEAIEQAYIACHVHIPTFVEEALNK